MVDVTGLERKKNRNVTKGSHFYIIQFIRSEAQGGWHKEFPMKFDDGPSQIISIILDRVQIS